MATHEVLTLLRYHNHEALPLIIQALSPSYLGFMFRHVHPLLGLTARKNLLA